MSRRVGVYARVSKAEHDRRTTSIPVQLADCRDRAGQESWTIVGQYVDEGISAWNRKKRRPEYEHLLADLEAGRIDTILVREQERLLRQMKDAVRIQELAEAGRLKLIAATMESDINFARARDRDEFRKRASQAEFYSDFLGEKIRDTKRAQRIDGAYTGGGPAFGYRRLARNGGPEVDPEQAALVHEAVARLGRGDSLYRIVVDWNAAGVPTAGARRWSPTGLKRLLLSEHLTGARGYPPILSEQEAAIVRVQLPEELGNGQTDTRGRRIGTRGRPAGTRYPLAGLLFCGRCGTKLTGARGEYRCSVGHGGCGGVGIKATPLERYLLVLSVRQGYRRTRLEGGHKPPAPAPKPEDTRPLLDELHEVEHRLDQVAEAIADGTLPVANGAKVTRALEERRRAIAEELARQLPPPQTIPSLNLFDLLRIAGAMPALQELQRRGLKLSIPDPDPDLARRWESGDLTEAEVMRLRDAFGAFFERVEIKRRQRRGHAFEPERVTISWR